MSKCVKICQNMLKRCGKKKCKRPWTIQENGLHRNPWTPNIARSPGSSGDLRPLHSDHSGVPSSFVDFRRMCIGQLPLLLRETPCNVPGKPRKQHLTCFKCFLQFLATWEVTTGVWGCVHVSMTICFKGSTASLMKHGIWERIWRHLHLIVSRDQAMFLKKGGVLKYGYPKLLAFPLIITYRYI